MKQTSIYTAALAAALMLILAACSDQQYDNDRTPGQQPGASGPLITVTATQGERPQTRLGYVDHDDISEPIEVTWAEKDMFYVGKAWPEFSDESFLSGMTEYFSPFTLKEGGAGSKNAEFEGNTPAGMQNGDKFYAIYGDGKDRIAPSIQEQGTLYFSYYNLQQKANGDQSHLSATDFMLATTTYTTDQQPVFDFIHLGAMMKFKLTLPTAGLTVKELTLTTTDSSKPFSLVAQWKMDGALAFSNCISNSNQLLLYLGEKEGITLTGTNVLTAYMMVAPTTLTKDTAPIAGKTLELKVTDANDVVYTATLKGEDIEQGKYYTVEAVLKKPAEKMSFTIQLDTDLNFTIPFPTEGTLPANITVDWGDKSEVTKMATGTELTSNTFSHPYSEAGIYTITITSSQTDAMEQQIPSFNFYQSNATNRLKLISMDTPMLNTGETTFVNCFNGCKSLTSLSEGLFNNNTQATNFGSCFYNCYSLTKLPKGLFDKNTQVTNFNYCFQNCTSLTSLPEDLFDKNTLVTNFESCFNGCTNLTSLPEGLFDKNTQVTNFESCFYGCTSLTSLPLGLFNNNTQATNFKDCFILCKKLVLNDKIFSSNANLDRFNDLTMQFSGCFQNTGSALTSEQQAGSVAPQLWKYNPGAAAWTTTECYKNCKANNLAEIPAGWGTPAN